MKVEFHPPRWFIYAAIFLISMLVGFVLLIALTRSINERSAVEKAKREQAVQQAKQQADSVYKKAEEQVELTTEKHIADSLAYVRSTATIKLYYAKKKNELDALYSSIDTITDNRSFGSFSVREMLSDSSCQLYR